MLKESSSCGSQGMEKRAALGDGDGGGLEAWRRWEGMNPELLAVIFVRIPVDSMLQTVPFVCRSWRYAVMGPYCWSEIDIEQLCRRIKNPDVIDPAMQSLVGRSLGAVRSISAYCIGNSSFSFIAEEGKFLNVLQIPMSEVTDEMVVKHASSLTALAVLDISYCVGITSKGIEALGKHCKSLVQLRRNMPPQGAELSFRQKLILPVKSESAEAEALAVASTMPKLESLELTYGHFSGQGLDAILTGCRDLRTLDITGCWNVQMKGSIKQRCEKIQAFRDSWDDEYLDISISSDDSASEGDDGVLFDVDTDDDSDDLD